MFKNNLAQGTIHAKHEKLYRQRKDKSAFQHQMSKVRPPCKGNHPEVVAPSQHTGQPVLFQQTLFFLQLAIRKLHPGTSFSFVLTAQSPCQWRLSKYG